MNEKRIERGDIVRLIYHNNPHSQINADKVRVLNVPHATGEMWHFIQIKGDGSEGLITYVSTDGITLILLEKGENNRRAR